MRVLIIEPEKLPYVKEIPVGLASLQHEVGGDIQAIYPWEEPCAIICDEKSKRNGKALNRALRDEGNHIYDIVAGTFLIVGLGEETFTSIGDAHIEQFKKLFSVPEMFLSMNGKLIVIPMEV